MQHQQQMINPNYYEFPIQAAQSQQQQQQHHQTVNGLPPSGAHGHYPMQSQQQQQHQQPQYVSNTNGSPQRRQYLSQDEVIAQLVAQKKLMNEYEQQQANAQLEYYNKNRSNSNLLDGDGQNIRELAGSPQRGNYLWKDQSPVGQPGMSSLNGGGQVAPNGVSVSQQINLINMRTQQAQQQAQQRPATTTMTQQYRSPYAEHSLYHHRSNPTSPTQQQQQQQAQMRYYNNGNATAGGATSNPSVSYHPALRGGVPVFPVNVMPVGGQQQQQQQQPSIPVQQQNQLSPQVKRRANAAAYGQGQQSTPTRPISFVRALEMSDSIELMQQDGGGQNMSKSMSDKLANGGGGSAMSKGGGLGGSSDRLLGGNSTSPRIMAAQHQNGGILVGGVQQQQQQGQQPPGAGGDRAASVYDMNYEISV